LVDYIPLYKPQNTVGQAELDAISEVFKSGWLTAGPKTIEFERNFSKFIGSKYAVGTSSCTSALYLSLEGVGIKKGVSVVVPVNTFVATANTVRSLGAEPVFCDTGEDGEIDPTKLESLIESDDSIECIVPVHLYGYPCDMKKISRIARKYRIKIVEDAAQAHGATFEGKKVGSFGEAGCFSFYATKNITTGEGGILVTDNTKLRDRALLLRNHGQNKTPKQKCSFWRFDVIDLGYNLRMSEIEAAIGLTQLEKIEIFAKSRLEIARRYKEELDKIDGIRMLHDPDSMGSRKGVYHLLEVTIEKEYPMNRDKLYRFLQRRGIITGVHYPPIHYFSYYQKTTRYKKGDFPCAEALYSKIISLPMFPFMTDQEFETIIRALKAKSPGT
jgi:perosamine synthetase